uniref:UDP-N-acetylglucosamine 1-carboxyvinyltransferase n=1 Tax=Acetatifactor sp. TaxID=1872090 RepID=UPI0040571A0D
MGSIHVQGGVALQGKVRIQGSKNAVLPILAATLLTKETSCIYNCPRIADVHRMVSLLRSLGVKVCWEENGIRVNAWNVCKGDMPAEAIKGMRSSLCLLGALIGRCGEVKMEYPGGCMIGERPIDLHIMALKKMGVCFREEDDMLCATVKELRGAEIALPFPSVGATENIILAAVMAEGDTIIYGAAREPEVVELCSYLEQCGADIDGIGTEMVTIHGGRFLYGTDYWVPEDRIVAGTYLFGAIATGGCVFLENAPAGQMQAVLHIAEKMGAQFDITGEGIYVQACKRPRAVPLIRTAPYPGFPTDLQSMALVAMLRADGQCMIEENIFENRFRIVEPLKKMGADIRIIRPKGVLIDGVKRLQGAQLEAQELRGGAALLLAALSAEGESTITGCSYIYRGYENICKDLRELGARVASV